MREKSAGVLLYREINKQLQFFIVHPGGPYGRGSDKDKWSIPKGKLEDGESELEAAERELEEETGIPSKDYTDIKYIGTAKQSRKDVIVFAARYIHSSNPIVSANKIKIEWPRKSGVIIEIPEVDEGEFVSAQVAKFRLTKGQKEIIDILIETLK